VLGVVRLGGVVTIVIGCAAISTMGLPAVIRYVIVPVTGYLALSVLSVGATQSSAPTRTTEVRLLRIIDAGNP
jgi:hypothetical protein